jgi:signal transduction histidine kinase
MNPTFLDETFHALAQPLMALRATVELGLVEDPSKLDATQVLGECLRSIDDLTQKMAMLREIASVDEPAALKPCDGDAILRGCVEEMYPVAHDHEVAIHLDAHIAFMNCDETMFRRAMFVLLDAMLAALPSGGDIHLRLEEQDDCVRLIAHPKTPTGLRQRLCSKLMHAAGGSVSSCATDMTVLFRKAARQLPPRSLVGEQVLRSR